MLLPEHIAVGEATAVTVGLGLTIRFNVRVLKHNPFAPLTVYVVDAVGVTTTLLPVNAPGFQL